MKHLLLTCALLMPLALAACDNKKEDQTNAQTGAVDVPAVAPAAGETTTTTTTTTTPGGAMANTPVPADTPAMQNTPVPGVSSGSEPGAQGIAVGEPNPATPTNTCPHQDWVGKTITDKDVVDELAKIQTPVRKLYPDSPATMDYNAERLNIILEHGTEKITEVRCG